MTLRAYRWRSDTRVEALGDLARDTPIANRTLAERQREAFAASGADVCDVHDPDTIEDREFLLFRDNLYASPRLASAFVAAARRRGATCQLALAHGPFTALTQFAGEQPLISSADGQGAYAYSLFYVRREPGPSVRALLTRAAAAVIDPGARAITIPFSSRIDTMSDVRVPVSDVVAFEITSWVHVWMANLNAIWITLTGLARSPRRWPWMALRAAQGAVTAGDVRTFPVVVKMLQKLSMRGRGCRIHPTAVVEASVLGRNVEIGPLAIVRGSIVGDGVRIFEQSVVDGSVLGSEVLVNPQALVKLTLAYPQAVFSWTQACVIGRRAFVSTLARPLDMKLEGTVRVRHRGRLVDTGLPFLGCCIGHASHISADTQLPPGRVVPNGYRIISDPSRQLTEIPDGLPTGHLLLERNGRLEPLRPTRSAEVPAEPDGVPGPRGAAAPAPDAAAPRMPADDRPSPRRS